MRTADSLPRCRVLVTGYRRLATGQQGITDLELAFVWFKTAELAVSPTLKTKSQ